MVSAPQCAAVLSLSLMMHVCMLRAVSIVDAAVPDRMKPDGGAACAAFAAAGAGAEEAQPLHVRLQNMPSSSPNPVVAALRGVLSFFATIVIIMTLWVIGAAAEGSLQARGPLGATAGGPGGGGAGGAGMDKGAASHAPKEYNKSNIPEASVKTFADVKGCDEAKEELQVCPPPPWPRLLPHVTARLGPAL